MVLAAEPVTVEEPEPTLLARADQELAAAMVEDHRRDIHVEIASTHPVGVRWSEIVGELQLLVRVDPDPDDRVAQTARARVEGGVARHHVDDAFRRYRRATAPPHAAAAGLNVLALRVARW